MVRVKRRSGLFNGYWWTLEGERIRRASRTNIAEAYRLGEARRHPRVLFATRVAFAAQPRALGTVCRGFKRRTQAEAVST